MESKDGASLPLVLSGQRSIGLDEMFYYRKKRDDLIQTNISTC